jgi:hypothetical protein
MHTAVPLRLKKAQKELANFVSRARLHGFTSVTGKPLFRQLAHKPQIRCTLILGPYGVGYPYGYR